jgi:hypothetical protein
MSDWVRQRVPFRFRIGEMTLFPVHRTLLMYNATQEALEQQFADIEPSTGSDFAGLDGFLVRSQPVRAQLPRVSRRGGSIRYVPREYERYYIDLRGGFEEYLAKFSSKSRSNLRKKVRRFADESGGQVDWRIYRTEEEIEEFHRLARRVSVQTYQERLLDAGLPDDVEFLQRARKAAAGDAVRAFMLFLRDAPIAYLYCPVRLEVITYAYLGYVPERSDLSPGTVLLLLALESMFNEGKFRFLDFTEGGLEGGKGHKGFFSTGSTRCADIHYLKPTAANWLLVLAHSGCDQTSALVGTVLDRLGLKARIKRLLRSGGASRSNRGSAAADGGSG